MKILQLCNKPPYPPVDGGTLAMNSITQGLLDAGHEVKVLSICSDKHPVREQQMPEWYREQTRFEAVYVDLGVKAIDAGVALLCGDSYHVKRFESKAFEQKLNQVLKVESFDVIHIESIFLASYVDLIRRRTTAPIVLRAHNVEYQIWQRIAQQTSSFFRRWYIKHLALSLRAYEVEMAPKFDGIACITEQDASFFRTICRRPIIDLPFGLVTNELDESVDVEPFSLFHIGSMDWLPNEESIRWFLQKVWPQLHREVPQARLYLAGRKMPADMMESQIEGVVMVGEVDDSIRFMASKQINIVPLLSGSGIRVKIIEAMSIGKTVISTTIGARGIKCSDNHDILIADTPDDFVRQVKRCIEDQDFCSQVGRNAFNLIANEYDNNKLSAQLLAFYQRLIQKKQPQDDE